MTMRYEASRMWLSAAALAFADCSPSSSGTTRDAGPGDAGPEIVQLAGHLTAPCGIAVDMTHVYWSDKGAHTIMKVPKGGGEPVTLATGVGDVQSPLAVDATSVYFADYDSGTVMKVALGGGTVETLVAGSPGSNASGVAVDASYVYFCASQISNGYIGKVPKGGGAVATLASGQREPGSVAVDATDVYWTNFYGTTVASV